MARRQRLSREESRARLLEAGADLFRQRPAGVGLEQVRVADVVDRLGLSVGALYHHWETQQDYRADLLDYLLDQRRFPGAEAVAGRLDSLIEDRDPIEAAAAIARDAWSRFVAEPDQQRSHVALWARADPAIDRRVARQYDDLRRAWARVLGEGLDRYDRRPRPPWTVDDLGIALTALVEGLFLRWRVGDESARAHLAEVFTESVASLIRDATHSVSE